MNNKELKKKLNCELRKLERISDNLASVKGVWGISRCIDNINTAIDRIKFINDHLAVDLVPKG